MSLVESLQSLIENPLKPNPSEWAMDCEDELNKLEDKSFYEQALEYIDGIQRSNGAFPQQTDMLVAILKRAMRSLGDYSVDSELTDDLPSYSDSVENALEASYRSFFERFEPDEDYTHLYKNVKNAHLKELFAAYHYELNDLFESMNTRLPSGDQPAHYWTNSSKDLLDVIRSILTLYNNFKNTRYSFEIDKYYKELFDDCLGFLKYNGGSAIPPHHPLINVIYVKPLFILDESESIFIPEKNALAGLKLIGKGSYAQVYKYKDEFYNNNFALKRALKNLEEKEIERFKREFETMKNLSSPYILEVYTYDEEKNEYIMEYMDETLEKYISKNNDKLDWPKRKGIAAQVLRGFIYTQNKGLLHRDISPNNILIKQYDDGSVVAKISDFGLVKIPDSSLTTYESEIKGAFNDPVLKRERFANYNILHESYALTLLIYFIMTGRVNIERENNQSLKAFLDKGLNVDKERRYKNAKEILSALQLLEELSK